MVSFQLSKRNHYKSFLQINAAMKPLWMCFLLFRNVIYSKNALEYFISKRNVSGSSVTILNDSWLEYKYILRNNIEVINITGELLRVAVFENGYLFDCDATETDVRGYSIDLVRLLANKLQLRTEFNVLTLDAENVTGNIDLLACHVENYDATHFTPLIPTLKSQYVAIYKRSINKDIYILTFVGTLWLCFVATFILLALCLRYSTRKYAEMDVELETWSWVDITLWAIAAACQQGLSFTPQRFASRLIYFLGYLMAYLLYTGFAAAITSVLLRQDNANINIRNVKGVFYGTVNLRSTYFKTDIKIVDTLAELFESIEHGNTVVGFVPELLLDLHIMNMRDYIVKPLDNFVAYERSLYVSKRSNLSSLINKELINLASSGITQRTLSPHIKKITADKEETIYSSVGLEHIGSAIYLLLGGIICSISFLAFECLLTAYKKYRQNN